MRKFSSGFLLLLLLTVLSGCFVRKDALKPPEPGSGARGSRPLILTPAADKINVIENEYVSADISHLDQGYLMLRWLGKPNRIKLQISGPANKTYTYNVPSDDAYHVYPFTDGSGSYQVNAFENVEGNQYLQVFSEALEVTLEDELLPFLYPNEYVSFTEASQAVALAGELAADSDDDLGVICRVFYYVVTNLTYDYDKAETVQSNYLPVIDETLATKQGICFDYASLMTAMLRSQGIPTRLEIGYVGSVYHAWISTWTEETGWIYNIIEFDGTTWNMMDPTFASTKSSGEGMSHYINNNDSYFVKYSY